MKTIEIPIQGMDCAECASHVHKAITSVEGVQAAEVYLGAEKAKVSYEAQQPDLDGIRKAVQAAGYDVGEQNDTIKSQSEDGKRMLSLLAAVFILVAFITIAGEWMGLFDGLIDNLPWYIWLIILAIGGYPVFTKVFRSAFKGQIISHTLMTLGVIAAMVTGEWLTAVIVVLFMRIGNYIEEITANKSRTALWDLQALAPKSAWMERNGELLEVSIKEISVGDVVIVRPGASIPVDGEVSGGSAIVDQSAITGEFIPIPAETGTKVYSAAIVQSGMLKVRATAIGADSTFGKVIQLVEEAEANRGDFQRTADRFAGYYLPIVAAISLTTFLIRGEILPAAAVLVVACSCSFSLATPIAILASIGSSARKGLLIKGGRYIEQLDKADTLFIDKTGTLTLGTPRITDIVALGAFTNEQILQLAASVEKYSEHPLAGAILEAAQEKHVPLAKPVEFKNISGRGVQARIEEKIVKVLSGSDLHEPRVLQAANKLKQEGKTLMAVWVDGKVAGLLGAADKVRPEVEQTLLDLKKIGVRKIMLLSGDHHLAVKYLADNLGVDFQSELLPDQKIEIVRKAQKEGHIVVMVGDGINDAPALAQADVGMAMGVKGSDIAIEAAHITLMREDWSLVLFAFQLAKKTMKIVRSNIIFTAIYNLTGLSLAAFGLLPPVFAAMLQSVPDLGILANSARLVRKN